LAVPTPQSEKSISRLRRVVIENVEPEVNGGRFPIKRTTGESVVVRADIYADGHGVLRAMVRYSPSPTGDWREIEMKLVENDLWEAEFEVSSIGTWRYTITAWLDSFRTWHRDFIKKAEAGQNVAVDILTGAELTGAAAERAIGADSQRLFELATELAHLPADNQRAIERANDPDFVSLMDLYPDRSAATSYEKELTILVDRERARFSTWYEMFPRSCSTELNRHGTFRDCIARLPEIAAMGFDVLYFPPIHPIGRIDRKGKNNTPNPTLDEPGSPWAIGSKEGGHKAIQPQLGTLADFKELQQQAATHGLEIALDLAFQCAPDHPYVKEHPEWFLRRPDGTVQYAENPPKKYQDIYPLNFESEDADGLREELRSVVYYWIKQGIRIFRVDNPHTKPFAFWDWLLGEVHRDYPETFFLAEAFTRPKVMYRLAKSGFTQSYTYFAWKNTKRELTEYFTELDQTPVREFFRPNLWANTPDILNEYLQNGGRPAFIVRLILAATLGASYGIYGPAFELCENRPVRQGSEEYLDSEKYQIRSWQRGRPDSLKGLIARVNAIRRENVALQSDWSLRFHPVENEQLIAYSKAAKDALNIILTVVNLDPQYTQSGWAEVLPEQFGLDMQRPFEVHDLLTDAQYTWRRGRNYVELNPWKMPAHIFRIRV
jgi:starch synthase (maltosyl-transferring)